MEVIFRLRIILRSKIKPWNILEWVKLRPFRNGGSTRLIECLTQVPNVRCRSFDTSTEHSMVIQNDHFALRIVLGVF
jgi:hypothetical protein